MLAYADCSIQMMSNSDPHLCDCNKIVDTDNVPVNPYQPDKQREISIKADWKYIGQTVYNFSSKWMGETGKQSGFYQTYVPAKIPQLIFHPPQA